MDTASTTFNTAILLIAFNRPDTTRLVLDAIRKVKPARFYIALDGPRAGVLTDLTNCSKVRSVIEEIDWECKVTTLFRDINLGCGMAPSTAITWFFEHETEGIILEDDCLPAPSFFNFCSQLLERYRYDTRVMEIGGNNLEDEHLREDGYSYRFSNLVHIWGWATWKRAWKLNDFYMKNYLEINKKGYLLSSYDTLYERDYYQYIFEKMHTGDEVTSSRTIWDYQWQFACKINSGLIIVPNRNLINNIGFGEQATNTLNPKGVGYNLKLESIDFPLRHPGYVMVDKVKDSLLFKKVCTSRTSRIKSQVKYFIPQRLVKSVLKPLMAVFA